MQGDKKMRLLQPQQMMAESRHVVDEAYAGDIIGVFDPGFFLLGILSAHLERNLLLRESRPSHRSILHVCARSIP